MRKIIPVCFVITLMIFILTSCSDSRDSGPNLPQDTIRFEYVAWGCECANWARLEDLRKYSNDGNMDSLAALCVYMEAANDSVQMPDTLGFSMDVIEFYGHYLPGIGFPNGRSPGESAEESRVFRYTGFRVIESHHYETMEFLRNEQ